jgi:hypothetical protein
MSSSRPTRLRAALSVIVTALVLLFVVTSVNPVFGQAGGKCCDANGAPGCDNNGNCFGEGWCTGGDQPKECRVSSSPTSLSLTCFWVTGCE